MLTRLIGLALAIVAVGLLLVDSQGQSIVINEIYYHPLSEDPLEEYIEVHNRGDTAVDLTGWRFTRGIEFTFPAVVVPPGGFLAVAADISVFKAKHPAVTAVVGGWTGTLSNRGERIELEDDDGTRVNRVTYADEGDWAVRKRSRLWMGYYTWDWYAEHDGLGKSLELIDSDLSNDCGQNWGASVPLAGTPGAPNSISNSDCAPLIQEVRHRPSAPRSSDLVVITARIEDTDPNGVVVYLHHRVDGQPGFTATQMWDDGVHDDGLANDAVFGAVLPPQSHNTVVEFYIRGTNAAGKERFWPADPIPAGTARANPVYQVDDISYAGTQPFLRIVMTEADRAYWLDLIKDPNGRFSNALMSATFVSVVDGEAEARLLVDVRNRGQGSRFLDVPNFHVHFRSDDLWHDVEQINLNADYAYVNLLASAICQMAGFEVAESRAAQVRLNNINHSAPGHAFYGIYVQEESTDGDYARNHLLGQANVYRCMRSSGEKAADLAYRGEDPNAYRGEYLKETNADEDDFSDLIELTRVLDATQTPDAVYAQEVERVLSVSNWMRFFALNTLLVNQESSLGNGDGDDYLLFPNPRTGRFDIAPRDLDTILNQGDTPGQIDKDIFVAARVPAINRFLKFPDFAPVYYAQLKELTDTVFSQERFDPLIDQVLKDLFPPHVRQGVKDFAAARRAFVVSQIPLGLTVSHGLSSGAGYLRSTTPAISISGRANAIETRSVRVNGQVVPWSGWEARWNAGAVPLERGINRVLIQALNSAGQEIDRAFLDVWYDAAGGQSVSGDISTDTTWEPSAGPFTVNGTLTIAPAATLTIRPGTTVYFDGAGRLVIRGRLVCAGNEAGQIRFTRAPGTGERWQGVHLLDSRADNILAFAHFEYGDGGGATLKVERSKLELHDVSWAASPQTDLEFKDASIRVERCTFMETGAADTVKGSTIPGDGAVVFSRNTFGALNGDGYGLRFSNAQRPGPILQLHDNLFQGSQVNAVFLVEADAHLEGNRFVKNTCQTGATIGIDGGPGYAPQVVLARNVFAGLDRAILLRHGAFAFSHNNTYSGVFGDAVHFGHQDLAPGVFSGAASVNDLFNGVAAVVTGLENLSEPREFSVEWGLFSGTPLVAGEGNFVGEARLDQADGAWRLGVGTEALGRGYAGLDIGADVAAGPVSFSNLISPTPSRQASVAVWGPGISNYQFQLDGGPRSLTRPISTAIELSDLNEGYHTLEVHGQNSAGAWLEPELASRLIWRIDARASSVLLNEVMAAGDSNAGAGGIAGDWVELVNRGDAGVDLAGKGITDDLSRPYRFLFPAGQFLGPGEHRTLAAAELGFALKRSGETIYLFDALRFGGRVLDTIEFGPQIDELSIGRAANGRWHLTYPTPDAPNLIHATGDATLLRINEWLARGKYSSDSDFVELYNPDTLPVALDQLYLSDRPGTAPTRHTFPPLSFVAPAGWLVLFSDANPDLGQNPLDFGLTADQGLVALIRSDGQVIDQVWYPPQQRGISLGREPDGAPTIVSLPIPGPGFSNTAPPPLADVRINELLADNRSIAIEGGVFTDWIELRNFSPFSASLAGMSLSDRQDDPRKYVFPPGTILPANGFLVVRCDSAQPVSATNTGFGLSDEGETVTLFHSPENGGGPADAIAFGFQAPDLALARSVDNPTLWAPAIPTPGWDNQSAACDSPAAVRVNEWMARLPNGDDWFELYNTGAKPVDLSGLYLTDDLGDPTQQRIADFSFLGSGLFGYRQLIADGSPENGPDHVDFKLSASGDIIALLDTEGRTIDMVVFGTQWESVSEGRLPDGSNTVVSFPRTASPGAMNYLDTDTDGMSDAWESDHGLNPESGADAALDPDHDDVSNFHEFRAGTNPRAQDSYLHIEAISIVGGAAKVQFTAQPGKEYLLEATQGLQPTTWTVVTKVRPRAAQQIIELIVPGGDGTRASFYTIRVE